MTQIEFDFVKVDLFFLQKCLMRLSRQEFIGLDNSSLSSLSRQLGRKSLQDFV